jgi:hypothetical protein
MKHLRETFTDQEFEALKQAKGKQNWHDFIIEGARLIQWKDVEHILREQKTKDMKDEVKTE